jgi:hypothetical protein
MEDMTARETTARQTHAMQGLPPELLGRIFSHLNPRDIAACRLVSRYFQKNSSSFLLPQVVFARRSKALLKLYQVLRHPYFRLHVTELVYDGSTYSQRTATSWEQYVEDCERAPRDLSNESWLEQERSVCKAREDLVPFRSSGPAGMSSGYRDTVVGDERIINDNAYRIGCHITFPRYRQYYADQQWIRRRGVDMGILSEAFASFPRLRSIVSSDYRSLARKGESYDQCCRRLFGRMLEPRNIGAGGQTGVTSGCLAYLLDILTAIPNMSIDSLALGPHAFEYTGEDTDDLAAPDHPQNPRYLDISSLENIPLGPDSKYNRVLNRLERLRLVLCYSGRRPGEKYLHDQVCRLLASSAPQMRSLTLHMIYLFRGGVREIPRVDHSTHFDLFGSIIIPLNMPHLRSLSLRRWIFTAEELKSFLLAHATTLRDLHILGCLCGDDETKLAEWGGRSLCLNGVELSGFLAFLDRQSANPYDWQTMDQSEWLRTRPKITEREARMLETIWLGGRQNEVQRQQRDEILPCEDWWKQPSRGM